MAKCSKCGVELLDSLIKQVEMKWEVGTVSRECSFSITYTLCPQCYSAWTRKEPAAGRLMSSGSMKQR